MNDELKELREAEKRNTERLATEGKCAETPDDLVGPGCEYEPNHEGRHSWGAFFEPDGSFHAMDPEAPYPVYKEFPFLNES
jgi:hypothetical protein